jgi:hypothetical protein
MDAGAHPEPGSHLLNIELVFSNTTCTDRSRPRAFLLYTGMPKADATEAAELINLFQ